MTDDDLKLAAFFAASQPPPREPGFSTEVMLAVARARFRAEVARLGATAVLGAVVLAAIWPVLQPALATIGEGLAPAGAALAAAVLAGLVVRERGLLIVGARA